MNFTEKPDTEKKLLKTNLERYTSGHLEETQQNFKRNETLDLEEHLSGKTDVAVYRQLLADFKAQLAKAKDITDTVTAGVFKLDFGQLKQRVLPAISRCIEQLYQVLPRIARKRMDSILKAKKNNTHRALELSFSNRAGESGLNPLTHGIGQNCPSKV